MADYKHTVNLPETAILTSGQSAWDWLVAGAVPPPPPTE